MISYKFYGQPLYKVMSSLIIYLYFKVDKQNFYVFEHRIFSVIKKKTCYKCLKIYFN